MANGAQQAVSSATRLSEIGFAEFTAKLITDTFNAITASYVVQTAQYIKVVEAVSQTLQDYINRTADDTSSDEISAFLVALGGLNDEALNFLLGASTAAGTLNDDEATQIRNAVALPPAAGSFPAQSIAAGRLTDPKRQTIVQAIARRIAANKYDLLQTMVRQGVLRLYVDNGTIETRLTFSTYGETVSGSSKTSLVRREMGNVFGAGMGGGMGVLVGPLVGGLGSAVGTGSSSTHLRISTSKESHRDVSGSRVQIYGRVMLNFKTDFLPLAATPL